MRRPLTPEQEPELARARERTAPWLARSRSSLAWRAALVVLAGWAVNAGVFVFVSASIGVGTSGVVFVSALGAALLVIGVGFVAWPNRIQEWSVRGNTTQAELEQARGFPGVGDIAPTDRRTRDGN